MHAAHRAYTSPDTFINRQVCFGGKTDAIMKRDRNVTLHMGLSIV